jgi:hypothetical protein
VKTAAVLLLAGAATGASAQHVEHAYLTVSGGVSSVQTRCLNDRDSCGLAGRGGRVLGGLFVNPGLAVEIVYMDFGRGREVRFGDSQQVGLRMVGLGSAAVLELGGGLAFTVHAGLAGTRTTRESTVALRRSAVTENAVDFYGGISALFRLNKTLAIEASIDALGLSDSSYRRDGGLMGSLGLSLRF